MEIIEKILDIILKFLNQRKVEKVEKEEEVRLEVEQKERVVSTKKRKRKVPQTPTDDNFFGD